MVQGETGWTAVRSLKRILEDAGRDTSVDVDGARYPLMDLLTGMVADLKRGLGLEPLWHRLLGWLTSEFESRGARCRVNSA